MKPRHQVSRAAIELIKTFEGYRRKAAQLPDGRWTIGYGHTLTAREGAEVGESDAEALLMYDLITVAHAVNEHSYTPLTQNQFDALCCFAFNVGVDNFRRSSVLRRVNEGQLLQAACAMEMWRKADFEGERIVIDALVRRRSAEKTLFLTPANGWIPAPSPVLRPKVDYDAVNAVPRETPTALKTSTVGDQVVTERDEAQEPRPQAFAPAADPVAAPLATEVAAAGVGAALEQLLTEPAPKADDAVLEIAQPEDDAPAAFVQDLPPAPPPVIEPETLDQLAPEPRMVVVELQPEPTPQPEPVVTLVQPQPQPYPTGPSPMLAVVGGDQGFTLTPAPETTMNPSQDDVFRIDMPEPANESAPGLFDVSMPEPIQDGGATRPLVNEDYIRRMVRQDEMAAMGDEFGAFETPTEPARINGLPLLGLGLGGIVLFAGGIAWYANTAAGQGIFTLQNAGFALALTGAGLTALAAKFGLDRLTANGFDDEDEDQQQPQG